MPNPYVNKVVRSNGTTLIDISDTTAVASDVASGKYFYLATGEKVAGSGSGGSSGYTRTVVVPQQTVTPVSTSLNGSTYYGATLNVSEGFEADAEYIITLNGTEYFFTCQVLWGTNYLLGDINYFYGASNLPYPFGIIWTSGTTCTLARDNGNQVTVKIEKLELTGSGGGGSATLITKSITANGTYSAEDDDADGYSEVTVNVPSGASNFVTGTFTTGSATSTREEVTIPYNGSGYPVMLVVVVEGGMYNGSISGWYNSLVRYAIGQITICKSNMTTTPTYDQTGSKNYGVVEVIYKNSTSQATSYSSTRGATVNIYTIDYPSGSSTRSVVWLGNKKLSYRTAGGTSSSYGLLASTTYRYYVVYSS